MASPDCPDDSTALTTILAPRTFNLLSWKDPSRQIMSSASSPSKSPSCTPPNGASCWICLEEGPDDSGAPLVRDCSCRGHSGVAHLQCLVQYAESKSRDFVERGAHIRSDIFDEGFFEQCPNCKQTFRGDIRRDMTKAQLAIEREFEGVHDWHLFAMIMCISFLNKSDEANRIEGERICDKLLTLIEKMEKNSYPALTPNALSSAYESIGSFNFDVGTKKSVKKAKYYLEQAIAVMKTSEDHGLQLKVFFLENKLTKVEARLNGDSISKTHTLEKDLSCIRVAYNYLRIHCETDVRRIEAGYMLASKLFHAYHTIEALRLLDELVVASRRHLGSSHEQTKNTVSLWKDLKLRCVFIDHQSYQVLRYESDRNIYVVNGPMPDGKKTFSVRSADISFSLRSPVMLHGLKKAAHLNGEIGDIRKYCESTDRYVVHLESKGLKTVKVKHENLRIVFDLPDPKKNLG